MAKKQRARNRRKESQTTNSFEFNPHIAPPKGGYPKDRVKAPKVLPTKRRGI